MILVLLIAIMFGGLFATIFARHPWNWISVGAVSVAMVLGIVIAFGLSEAPHTYDDHAIVKSIVTNDGGTVLLANDEVIEVDMDRDVIVLIDDDESEYVNRYERQVEWNWLTYANKTYDNHSTFYLHRDSIVDEIQVGGN